MKSYLVNVVDSNGNKKSLVEKAISKELLQESISSRGYYIVSIKEHSGETPFSLESIFEKKLDKKFLLDFCYNVYNLLEFGIDINEVFKIVANIFVEKSAKEFIASVSASLNKGDKLSQAIKGSNGAELFDGFIMSMITSGEMSGQLTEAFKLIYSYLESERKLREKTVSSIIYPSFLLFLGFLAFNMLLFIIIPNIRQMYDNMGFEPKGVVGGVMAISSFLQENMILYVISLIAVIVGLVIFFRTSLSKRVLNVVLVRLPVVSTIFKLQSKIKVSFSLEILLKGGSTLEESLIKLATIETNEEVKKEYNSALLSLKSGDGVRASFENLKVFDNRDLSIIEISDSISRSTDGFGKIYKDTEKALNLAMERVLKMVEPMIILVIGLLMGFLMYLIISPTLSMLGNF